MAVILRVDVDNAYGYETFGKKVLNYLRLNYSFPKVSSFGYLMHLKNLISDLDERTVKTTFFFKARTVPKKSMCQRVLRSYNIGFHAVRTADFEEFLEDFERVNSAFMSSVHGLSKHGSGKWEGQRGHTWQYDPERCINHAQKLGLKYFSGNRENPSEKKTIVNGVVFFPSAFWLSANHRQNKFSVDWLVEETQKRDVVTLFHPYEWNVRRQVRQDYEEILDKVDEFKTFDEATQ